MTRTFSGMVAVVLVLVTALVAGTAGPVAADDRQRDKNLMRNLGMGLGALAVHQAVKGKTTNAIALGAGAAYAAKKYEDQRKAQARDTRARRIGRASS